MKEARSQLLEQLAARAGDHPLRLFNGSQKYTYGGLGAEQVTMYGFAQCARYLAPSECTRCLMDQVAYISDSKNNIENGYIKGFSCYTKFQPRWPIDITMPPLPPPPAPAQAQPYSLPPSTMPSTSTSRGGSKTPLIAGLAVAAGTVMLLVAVSISAWALSTRRRRRCIRSRTTVMAEEGSDFFDDEAVKEEFKKGTGPRRFRYQKLWFSIQRLLGGLALPCCHQESFQGIQAGEGVRLRGEDHKPAEAS